jgi:hypothetical protein
MYMLTRCVPEPQAAWLRAVLALGVSGLPKACIGSGRATVNGFISPTSLAEAILTLIWLQNFVNI